MGITSKNIDTCKIMKTFILVHPPGNGVNTLAQSDC
jgi:hypothetical protein